MLSVIEERVAPEVIQQARPEARFELYAWFFMRLSGLVLMVLAVFHLLYMHFIIPGGIAGINYETIVARWTDPVWGFFWRTFDLLLLIFGLSHGSNGLRYLIDDYLQHEGQRIMVKMILVIIYLVLIVMGTTIIFNFSSTNYVG
jgi:succinate dehydrogenase / fumarate reductase membrane anchor subunit